MLLGYLRRSRLFRAIFAIPIAIRRKWIQEPYRIAAQNYQRTVVGGEIIVQPDNIDGRFRVGAKSDLARRVVTSGDFEPDITNLLNRIDYLEGDIINVGANVGFFAIHFAARYRNAQRIIAIEPNPEAFNNLEYNITENGHDDRVLAKQICIGDEPGEIEFAVIPGMPEYSSIGGIVHPSAKNHRQQKISLIVQHI